SQEAAQQIVLLEKQGVTFGFLSYTYGLNGLSLPRDKPWMVSVLDGGTEANEARLAADVAAIRPLCDYLIVSMHWGVEYTYTPTSIQKKQAQLLCDLGTDLIIGHHPHVLQPLEWLESPEGRQTLCMYSLGNFVSNQQRYDTLLGGLLEVELTFDPETHALMQADAGVNLLVTHYANKHYTTYLLKDYNDDLARIHGVERTSQVFNVNYLTGLAQTVMGDSLIWESN
ncbi:MAG: CapA family protein, partial [Syntrophomonadaceae bacterium]|nr:CapA family protein [Syntrophomonadaceae bacterium]